MCFLLQAKLPYKTTVTPKTNYLHILQRNSQHVSHKSKFYGLTISVSNFDGIKFLETDL